MKLTVKISACKMKLRRTYFWRTSVPIVFLKNIKARLLFGCNFGPSGENSRVPQWTDIRCRIPQTPERDIQSKLLTIQVSTNTETITEDSKTLSVYVMVNTVEAVTFMATDVTNVCRVYVYRFPDFVPFMVTKTVFPFYGYRRQHSFSLLEIFHGSESLFLNRFSQDFIWSAGRKYYKHFQNDTWIFHDNSPEYVFICFLFSPCQK
jgi:hypothetical protein